MFMRYLIISASIFCFLLPAHASDSAEKEAVSSAMKWLKVVDQGNYPGSWENASDFVKGAVN